MSLACHGVRPGQGSGVGGLAPMLLGGVFRCQKVLCGALVTIFAMQLSPGDVMRQMVKRIVLICCWPEGRASNVQNMKIQMDRLLLLVLLFPSTVLDVSFFSFLLAYCGVSYLSVRTGEARREHL